MQNETVTIQSHDGSEFTAYVTYPVSERPEGAVLVIQEIFGVNANMREICQSLSNAGYVAICPDLFWRQEPNVDITDQTEEEWAKAFELFNGFDIDLGVKDLTSTLDFIRNHEKCNGKVGTVGYCLGGQLAFLMACRSDADCNVSYYGVGLDNFLGEADAISSPLLMHVAELDKFVPEEARDKIVAKMDGHPQTELYVYREVDHAFARVGGEHYDEKAAAQANISTADFLAKNLIEQA